MAQEIRQFTAVIPAGTAKTAPVRVDMSFPPRQVDTVEIRVPPGPSGLVGFALQNSGVTIIPYQSDAFIVTAADYISWPLHGFVTSGSWQLLGYNTGTSDHAIYVRFLLSLPWSTPPGAPALIDSTDLSSPVTASGGTLIEGLSG